MTGFICLIGPPAAGKSTIARTLTGRSGVRVFRLREFARHARITDPRVRRLLAGTDAPGWCGDSLVAYCLRRAFVEGRPPLGVVVLEDLPGSHVQMGQVHAMAALREAPLLVVELDAPDRVLRQRAAAGPARPAGGSRPCGGPHLPARRDAAPDVPAVFDARLARYRERIVEIRRGAALRGGPCHRVDASRGVDDCVDAVLALCRPLLAVPGAGELVP